MMNKERLEQLKKLAKDNELAAWCERYFGFVGTEHEYYNKLLSIMCIGNCTSWYKDLYTCLTEAGITGSVLVDAQFYPAISNLDLEPIGIYTKAGFLKNDDLFICKCFPYNKGVWTDGIFTVHLDKDSLHHYMRGDCLPYNEKTYNLLGTNKDYYED